MFAELDQLGSNFGAPLESHIYVDLLRWLPLQGQGNSKALESALCNSLPIAMMLFTNTALSILFHKVTSFCGWYHPFRQIRFYQCLQCSKSSI